MKALINQPPFYTIVIEKSLKINVGKFSPTNCRKLTLETTILIV
jgi:hypothetical protein